jgi:hypothetical protein
VRHFHEKLGAEHGITLSYTWVKAALQGAGLVKARKHRGKHRKRRPAPLGPKTKTVEMPPLRKAIKNIASLSGLEKSRQKAA